VIPDLGNRREKEVPRIRKSGGTGKTIYARERSRAVVSRRRRQRLVKIVFMGA